MRRRSWFVIPAACVGGLIAIAWGLWSLYVIAVVHHRTFIENYCTRVSACDAATGFVAPVLTVAIATAVFLMWREWRLKKPIVRKAREDPRELVPTAGTIVGRIVGRTELCLVIMRAIRNRDYRRPYLLVGGVGVGKTTVLVQLTKMLAEYRAVPVPVRLRDVETELNFGELAREQFCNVVDSGSLPEGQSARVWRQLRRDDKIVVLADGLEEAFPEGNKNEKDRDNLIRRAIQQAEEQKLPLVITSRPHHPLEATAAAIMELEPLSEEAALDYVVPNIPVQDARRLDWIIETASVADAPLYLQITRQLYKKGLLEHLTTSKGRKLLDTREVDRSALRWRLLDTWGTALADGHLRPEIPLSPEDRKQTINLISALACVGLLKDTLEVSFEDLIGEISNDECETPENRSDRAQASSVDQAIWNRVRRENWEDLYSSETENKKPASPQRYLWLVSLAATRADQLGIVEAYGNRVRFHHSILQAYLGCRFLDSLLQHPGENQALGRVLEEPGPGRELLIALCLYSRAEPCEHASKTNGRPRQTGATEPVPSVSPAPVTAKVVLPTAAGAPPPAVAEAAVPAIEAAPGTPAMTEGAPPTAETAPVASATTAVAVPADVAPVTPARNSMPTPGCETCTSAMALTETLRKAAEEHTDAKAFDIYAAALEIDSIQAVPLQQTIAESLCSRWQKIVTGDRRTLEEAKLGLVLRFGEALREVARPEHALPAYSELFRIGCLEESYPVRLAIAQEIGSGGDKAFTALCCNLSDPLKTYNGRLEKPVDDPPDGSGNQAAREALKATDDEQADPHGAEDATQEDKTRLPSREENNRARGEIWREFVLRAWITPLLVGSVSDARHDEAERHLEAWLDHLQPQNSQRGRAELPLSLEIALAQGFKAAANRRKRNPYTSDKSRVYLIHKAEEMLKYARYWFTQLTLIHALCLWALPDDTGSSIANRTTGNDGYVGGKELANKDEAHPRHRGTGPSATVARWLSMAGSKCAPADRYATDGSGKGQLEHPFVAEAGDLAALALESRIPGRFIWIDESGIVSKVGSRPASPSDYRKHNLWIPPSSGWSALDRRAQQLVADVLIMLNLTEQAGSTESPLAREHRLENANRSTLPPCLTRDRRPLQPGRTIGSAVMASHGSTCLDDCQFELCPYPPSGAQPRAELSEAFCRRQQSLLAHRLRRPGRKTAPWQGLTPKELEFFWAQMAWRSRPARPEE